MSDHVVGIYLFSSGDRGNHLVYNYPTYVQPEDYEYVSPQLRRIFPDVAIFSPMDVLSPPTPPDCNGSEFDRRLHEAHIAEKSRRGFLESSQPNLFAAGTNLPAPNAVNRHTSVNAQAPNYARSPPTRTLMALKMGTGMSSIGGVANLSISPWPQSPHSTPFSFPMHASSIGPSGLPSSSLVPPPPCLSTAPSLASPPSLSAPSLLSPSSNVPTTALSSLPHLPSAPVPAATPTPVPPQAPAQSSVATLAPVHRGPPPVLGVIPTDALCRVLTARGALSHRPLALRVGTLMLISISVVLPHPHPHVHSHTQVNGNGNVPGNMWASPPSLPSWISAHTPAPAAPSSPTAVATLVVALSPRAPLAMKRGVMAAVAQVGLQLKGAAWVTAEIEHMQAVEREGEGEREGEPDGGNGHAHGRAGEGGVFGREGGYGRDGGVVVRGDVTEVPIMGTTAAQRAAERAGVARVARILRRASLLSSFPLAHLLRTLLLGLRSGKPFLCSHPSGWSCTVTAHVSAGIAGLLNIPRADFPYGGGAKDPLLYAGPGSGSGYEPGPRADYAGSDYECGNERGEPLHSLHIPPILLRHCTLLPSPCSLHRLPPPPSASLAHVLPALLSLPITFALATLPAFAPQTTTQAAAAAAAEVKIEAEADVDARRACVHAIAWLVRMRHARIVPVLGPATILQLNKVAAAKLPSPSAPPCPALTRPTSPACPLPLSMLVSLAALARTPTTASQWSSRAHARISTWALHAPVLTLTPLPACPRAALAHAFSLLPLTLQPSPHCPLAPLPLPPCTCAAPCLWPRMQADGEGCVCLRALRVLRAKALVQAAVPVLRLQRVVPNIGQDMTPDMGAPSSPSPMRARVHVFLTLLRRGRWLAEACAASGLTEIEAEAIVEELGREGALAVTWDWV